MIEDILNYPSDKIGKTYNEYAVLSFYRNLIYDILSMFISLWIENFIEHNRNIIIDDITYIYSLFSKLIKEGNNMFIFYINEISLHLF